MDKSESEGCLRTPSPRAEEIIAEIYRQIVCMQKMGRSVSRVVINRKLWEIVDRYRSSLGMIQGVISDYLGAENIFGIEIWYDNDVEIRVE